jgi:signal transduction histidine kinase
LSLELRRLNLREVVKTAVEALAPSVDKKRIGLTVETDEEPVWVMGDSTRLGQVVSNLLSNAIGFTLEAGRIEISLRAGDDVAVLVLRDDGEGIEGSRLADIFEPPDAKTAAAPGRTAGLGLGLTIVRLLLAQHGGTITAESAGSRRGSCFTVTLPRHTIDSGG